MKVDMKLLQLHRNMQMNESIHVFLPFYQFSMCDSLQISVIFTDQSAAFIIETLQQRFSIVKMTLNVNFNGSESRVEFLYSFFLSFLFFARSDSLPFFDDSFLGRFGNSWLWYLGHLAYRRSDH